MLRHHKHPGLVGQLAPSGRELEPHPDAGAASAVQVLVPLPDDTGREIDAVESITCVATRDGAARVVAVPHIAVDLAMGDELAVGDWEGNPVARGPLASSLLGTVRIVAAATGDIWEIAGAVDATCRAACDTEAWFDVMSAEALAVAVPRAALAAVFVELESRAARDELRWEYATAGRHAQRVAAN